MILKEHDVVIKDKKEIANIFNNFVNTARDLIEITGYYAEDFVNHPSIIIIHKNNTKEPDKDCFRFQLTNKIQERKCLFVQESHLDTISCHHGLLRTIARTLPKQYQSLLQIL